MAADAALPRGALEQRGEPRAARRRFRSQRDQLGLGTRPWRSLRSRRGAASMAHALRTRPLAPHRWSDCGSVQGRGEPFVSPSDVAQCGPGAIRDVERARSALRILARNGCVASCTEPVTIGASVARKVATQTDRGVQSIVGIPGGARLRAELLSRWLAALADSGTRRERTLPGYRHANSKDIPSKDLATPQTGKPLAHDHRWGQVYRRRSGNYQRRPTQAYTKAWARRS